MYFEEKRSWMLAPEPVSEERIRATVSADIVIIGAGYSGVFCARKAREGGRSVILLEKAAKANRIKNFFGGSEYAAFNSKFGLDKGVPEYDPIDYILEYQKRSLGRCNCDLVRQLAYSSGEAFDWFIEPLPSRFKEHITVFMLPGPSRFEGEISGFKSFAGTMMFDKPGTDGFSASTENRLEYAMAETIDMIEAQGVDIRYGMEGRQLEKADGRVSAVIAANKEGEYFRFQGNKAVVLACGDFGGNHKMVADLLDEYAELQLSSKKPRIQSMGRDGSGIRMGIWAGGHIQAAPRGGMYCGVCNRAGHMGGAAFLRLNVKGKRYVNEGLGNLIAGFRGARQPEGFIATIFDASWREEYEYQSYEHGTLDFWGNDPYTYGAALQATSIAPTIGPVGFQGPYNKILEPDENGEIGIPGSGSAAGLGSTGPWASVMYAADTLEELADYLGYEGEAKKAFLASIERYNELCRKGRDEDFAKDSRLLHPIEKPPFYGVKMEKNAGFVMVTEAGLVVDENQQVLDEIGEPIAGLYATGQCAGDVFPIQYAPPIGGSGIGTCTTLGYVLGRHLSALRPV